MRTLVPAAIFVWVRAGREGVGGEERGKRGSLEGAQASLLGSMA